MVQIAAKKDTKKKIIDEGQEIRDLLISLGGREITEEEARTEEYKRLFELPLLL
jgi:hypothetical protein